MTYEEALDVVAQAGPLIESLEKLLQQAALVLEVEPMPPLKTPPVLTVVSDEHTSDYGSPANWEWGDD